MWISRAQMKQLKEAAEATTASVERIKDLPVLVSLERNGRVNKFIFARGEQMICIETMGLISDDFGQWRKDLGV
jgi:hypothetical protein